MLHRPRVRRGVVTVNHTPGVANPADLFTKILSRQVFEKHRKFVLNLPAGAAADLQRSTAKGTKQSDRVSDRVAEWPSQCV